MSSVIIAVQSLQELSGLRRNRVWVLYEPREVTEYFSAQKAQQCHRCQKLGHHHAACKTDSGPVCRFCIQNHPTENHQCPRCNTSCIQQWRPPPPAFATTSMDTIDFSIGFGFAALIYVSLEIFREFYVDFVHIHHEIRVFTRFRLPHHAKCRPNIVNYTPHTPKPVGTRTKLLWTLLVMGKVFPLMEEMKEPMDTTVILL
jgi:uncharacterized paraquat-inducible protein A